MATTRGHDEEDNDEARTSRDSTVAGSSPTACQPTCVSVDGSLEDVHPRLAQTGSTCWCLLASPHRYRKELALLAPAGLTAASCPTSCYLDWWKSICRLLTSEEGCKPDKADSDDEDDDSSSGGSSSSAAGGGQPWCGRVCAKQRGRRGECALRLYHQHKAWERTGYCYPHLAKRRSRSVCLRYPHRASRRSCSERGPGYLDLPDSDDEEEGARGLLPGLQPPAVPVAASVNLAPLVLVGQAAGLSARLVRDPEADPVMHLIRAALRVYKQSMGSLRTARICLYCPLRSLLIRKRRMTRA